MANNSNLMTNTNIPQERKKVSKNREGLSGFLFVLPWVIGFIVFTLGPMLFSLVISFCKWDYLNNLRFIGFTNYLNIFTSDQYSLTGLGRTLTFVFFEVPYQLILSLIIALFLNQKLKFVNLTRAFVYLPVCLAGVVSGLMWRNMYDKDLGIFNYFLSFIGIQVKWLLDPKIALFSVAITGLWAIGVPMLLFLAALKSVPDSYYEAAELDGANPMRKFLSVTLPCITPTILYNIVNLMIQQFLCYTPFRVITEGGPVKATYMYSLYEFDTAFQFLKMGYASALSWVMFVVILTVTLIVIKTSKYWVFYEAERGGEK